MHSHSFQDTELKFHRFVKDYPGQVVEGFTILRYFRGLRNKELITRNTVKFNMHSHSFQDTELKLHSYVDDHPEQVVKGLMILRYPRGLRKKGLITQKYINSHSFKETKLKLHRYIKVYSGQVMEGLKILLFFRGLRNKGLITQNTVNSTCIRTVFKIQS